MLYDFVFRMVLSIQKTLQCFPRHPLGIFITQGLGDLGSQRLYAKRLFAETSSVSFKRFPDAVALIIVEYRVYLRDQDNPSSRPHPIARRAVICAREA